MALFDVLFQVVGVSVLLLVVCGLTVLGTGHLQRFRSEWRSRLRGGLPPLGLLGGVLVLNGLLRTTATEVSWLIGLNITVWIHQLEGAFVYALQQWFGPVFTALFSFLYVYGYILILVFPLIAYLTFPSLDTFHELVIAFAVNYTIGLICYIVFIAYGPRILLPELVGEPMYVEYPEFQLLTSQINQKTNVFPSLHASLTTTVMAFAWRTRRTLPRWTVLGWLLGTGVIVSTMYLGIHWLIDVLAGLVLGLVSVWLGIQIHRRRYLGRFGAGLRGRLPGSHGQRVEQS